jgi:putative cell wall-binding protein
MGLVVAPIALTSGTAFAAPALTITTPTVANAALITPGATSSGRPTSLTFTLGAGAFTSGDLIALDLSGNSNAQGEVGFDTTVKPVVSFTGATPTTPTPTFTTSFGNNSGDASPATATNDELDITLTSGNASNTTGYTVTVSGLRFTAGPAAAAPVNRAIGVSYISTTGGFTTATSPTAVTVPAEYNSVGTPASVPANSTTALPTLTLQEVNFGSIPSGATNPITVTLTDGATFTSSTPTVTSNNTGVHVGTVTATGATLTFNTSGASTLQTGPVTFTITGIQVSAAASTADSVIGADVTQTVGGTTTSIGNQGSALGLVSSANTQTIAGADADTTAALEYRAKFPYSGAVPARPIVLATDSNFPDALSGAYLEQSLGAGVLLVQPGALPSATETIIAQDKPSTIYVLGGPVAVSQTVYTQIQALYNNQSNAGPTFVTLAGSDQFGTNQQVVDATHNTTGSLLNLTNAFLNRDLYNDTTGMESAAGPGTATTTAIVASGTNFPDALAASVLSYRNGIPIILTQGTTLSPTAQNLLQGLGVRQVILMGGPAAVSDTVEGTIAGSASGDLNIPVLRIAGQDATDTAQLLASFETGTAGIGQTGLGLAAGAGNAPFATSSAGSTFIARGDFYTDALAAAPLLATDNTPLLLTEDPNTVGQYLTSYLNTLGSLGIGEQVNFGGPAAIAPATIQAVVSAEAAGADNT